MKNFKFVLLGLALATAPGLAQSNASTQADVSAKNQTSTKVGESGPRVQSNTSASANAQAQALQKNVDHQTNAKTKASGDANASTSDQSGSGSLGLASGSTMEAVLTKPVDSRKCKPGDPVMAKTTQDVKQDGKVVLPKNSRLIGHVTEVQAREKGQSESKLGMVFDRAVMKDGREVPANFAIQAIAAAESSVAANSHDADLMGSASGMGAVSGGATRPAPASGSGGGGLVGGVTSTVGATANTATSTVGNVASTAPGNLGATANSATSATGSASHNGILGSLNSTSSGVLGIQGLNLMSESAGSAQGSIISSSTRNVRLDGGTRMLLRAVPQPQ
ncbi:MAG: TrbI/VirB10 family protein [Acidobacteria bacterium]|nr:TrbI/VirB10 family protein [Acidobacteriota bacterium]